MNDTNKRDYPIAFRDVRLQAKLAQRVDADLKESAATLAKSYLQNHFYLIEQGIGELKAIFSPTELHDAINLEYEPSWLPAEFIPVGNHPLAQRLASMTPLQKMALADLIRCRRNRLQREATAC